MIGLRISHETLLPAIAAVLTSPARRRETHNLAGPTTVRGRGPVQNRLGDVAQQQPAIFFSIRRSVLAKGRDGSDLTRHFRSTPSDMCSVSEGIAQVRTIIARNRTTETIDITRAARDAATALVNREYRRTMSRMVAYENVAATIGASSSWLRKFVNCYPDAKPDLVVGFNILVHYARITAPTSSSGG